MANTSVFVSTARTPGGQLTAERPSAAMVALPAPAPELFMADESKMARTEVIISYIFHDKAILWEALQAHVDQGHGRGQQEARADNSRLALVGDRIASQVLVEDWYRSGHPRGSYSSAEKELLSNHSLACRVLKLGLHKCVQSHGGIHSLSTWKLATIFEAIIGAVYLDSGNNLEVVRRVVRRVGIDYASSISMTHVAGGTFTSTMKPNPNLNMLLANSIEPAEVLRIKEKLATKIERRRTRTLEALNRQSRPRPKVLQVQKPSKVRKSQRIQKPTRQLSSLDSSEWEEEEDPLEDEHMGLSTRKILWAPQSSEKDHVPEESELNTDRTLGRYNFRSSEKL